jgi:Tol biopolymer transport system component
MNQRSTLSVAVFWATLLCFFGFVPPLCHATIGFANHTTSLMLDTTNALLYINDPAKITGWTDRSIIKSYGDIASSLWPEGYATNTIVAQTGGTIPARTDLVDCNSNAINTLASGPISAPLRTTSNLLLFTARTDSSSLWVLRSRADSTNVGIRTTSNAVNSLYQTIAVPTANSIDGSIFPRYVTNHYVFHNGAWTARGWVRFNNGFTVMPSGSVLMDTLTTVSGGFDLRDTGTLILNNDLYLAHNVTLTDGGNIKGKSSAIPGAGANTIFMGGDLTLASTTYARTLHITGDWSNSGTSGDLVIDGGGHTLNIGDRAQLFVDQNVTLTLRNMTIKTGPKSLFRPAIQLASPGSKLALDNVLLDLGTDFKFVQGQIFIHDEVAVTGTSAFVYNSPAPSYITSGATWSFESSTTFSVAPATFTDSPYLADITGPVTSNNFIVLADASAALSLDNCSLQTTFTGLRLRSGMVLFDNKVAVNTQAGVDLASTTTTPVGYLGGVGTGNGPYSVAWSPDGRFLAVVNDGAATLQVYRLNASSVPPMPGTTEPPTPVGGTATTGTNPFCVAWSPDGRFLAVANEGSTGPAGLQVYRFNGSSTPTSLGTATTGNSPQSVAWSPDGRFLAVANEDTLGSNGLQVYRFNGSNAPTSLGTATTGTYPWSVAWSPDGRFLAVANEGSPTTGLQVYRFNGGGAPTSLGTATTGNAPFSVAWSPDGRFLAVVNEGSNTLQVYRFNGSNQPTSLGTVAAGNEPESVAWSPDGRFLAVVNVASSTTGLQVYRFNGSSAPTSLGTAATGSQTQSVAWSPDGRFLAVVNYSSNTLQVFYCNYYYTGQPSATQGFSNGLLFGNQALGAAQGLGSAYDANVQVLAGAVVKVKGMVRDDSF